jgi:hypothetical protein
MRGARKAINLFLRDAFYNRYLFDRFKLKRIEYFLEIPLDRIMANGLREEYNGDKSLPPWPGLKKLEHKDGNKYQRYAITLANKYNMARVHIDMYLWLKGRSK